MDLDANIFPVVHDGGVVEPGQSQSQLQEPGMGDCYERQTTRGSTAGSWARAAGGPWTSGRQAADGSRPAGETASIFSEQNLSDAMAADLAGVIVAYPTVEFRFTPDLVWIIQSINPIRGLSEIALLITAYPKDPGLVVKSWAWWGPGLIWIGPRHTNYPDGSICSFEPNDPDAWKQGNLLLELLDIHIVWIVRHLFLRYFGYWPGSQIFHTAYERLKEQRPGEVCGGCRSGLRYDDCCRSLDERCDPVERLISFTHQFGNRDRNPPQAISEFVYGVRKTAPSLNEFRVASAV